MGRKPFFEIILQHFSESMSWVAIAAGAAATIYWVYKRKKCVRPPRTAPPSVPPPPQPSKLLNEHNLLNQVREITGKICIAWETLLEEGKFTEATKSVLQSYCATCDVFLMCRINNNEDKTSILKQVADVAGLERHKILFCSTHKGYEAFTRQVGPSLLVTVDPQQASFLSGVLPFIALVGGNGAAVAKSNVIRVESVLDLRAV